MSNSQEAGEVEGKGKKKKKIETIPGENGRLSRVEEEENEKSRRRGEFHDRGSKEGKKREKKGKK